VAKYLPRPRKPPSQTWRTFLMNHLAQTAAIDFFTVPTATFRVLFVFVVLSHERRRVLHFGVTEHPTQEWTMQQMRESFPWEEAPRYVRRDRDAIYGRDFADMTGDMGIEEVLTAPRSPWQNPLLERLVGSIRRECLDHVIVWNERSLRRTLQSYFAYYQRSRTHLALGKDAPEPRALEPPARGRVIAIPLVGGLHQPIPAPGSIVSPDEFSFPPGSREPKQTLAAQDRISSRDNVLACICRFWIQPLQADLDPRSVFQSERSCVRTEFSVMTASTKT